MTTIRINDAEYALPADPRISLLDFLRDHLHLSGAKKGCNQGACSAPSLARPSMEVMARSWYWTASAMQDRMRSPSASTVHAPHAPWLQPFLAPDKCRWSRRKSSSEMRAAKPSRCPAHASGPVPAAIVQTRHRATMARRAWWRHGQGT